MSPEESYHTHNRTPDPNKPKAIEGCTELERRQTTVVATETHFVKHAKSTDDIKLTATRTMLRDVMLLQTNVSHQKRAPKGKQAT